MEFMFNEMDQAIALSIHLYAVHEFYQGEKSLQASVYYLMTKRFGSRKKFKDKKLATWDHDAKRMPIYCLGKNKQQGRRMNELRDH